MCGIVGEFAYQARRPGVDEDTLWRMTDALAHRGPDDRGIHFDPDRGIALGHRRLSIIDLSDGHQPMASDDGSLWIVYNGEVYNHTEIRKELEADGVRFRTRCDTEVILRLYQAVGRRCVERLNGMFAFAIWDARERRVFLARDRIGIKPLYWVDRGGRFLFASEPRALFEHAAVSAELDAESLYHHLSFLCTPAPRTMFAGVNKLRPGHWAEVSEAGIREEPYWDVLEAPGLTPEEMRAEPAAEAIRERLRASIESRMMSDVPFGVFLSGGVDSSANVALMSECSSLPVNTFTVAYEGPGVGHLNELEHARRVAAQYGTNHREVVIDQRSLLDYLPRFVEHQDEPVADPVCVPLFYVSQLAVSEGVKVVQVGEGSDELFLGYDLYREAIRFSQLLRPLRALPRPLRRGAYGLAGPVLRSVGHRALRWEELLRRAVDEDTFWGGAIILGDREKHALMGPRSPLPSSWSVIEAIYADIDRKWPQADVAQRMTFLELRQRLPELLLARVDKITMSVSLEARVPFLDHRLVEHALRLPVSVKLEGGRTKAVLKRAIEGLLPEDLIHRRKQGFPAPISQWLHTEEFGRHLSEALVESPLIRDGYLAREPVLGLLEAHRSRRADHGQLLWVLFNLTLWYQRWILGE
jgi:asparagine synthase (glutamine-hydrolysing)